MKSFSFAAGRVAHSSYSDGVRATEVILQQGATKAFVSARDEDGIRHGSWQEQIVIFLKAKLKIESLNCCGEFVIQKAKISWWYLYK